MSSESLLSFQNEVLDRAAVEQKIIAGEFLILAGDENVLAGLPSGNWIAGTIPYFMAESGGCVDQQNIYVTTLAGASSSNAPRITLYDENSIARIAQEAPQHGFTVVILPAGSGVHTNYAQNAPEFPNMYFSPLIGWIAGAHLNELDAKAPKVGFGPAAMLSEGQAVAMHVPISEQQNATVSIVNLFEQGEGDVIRFSAEGFDVTTCTVNGETQAFADYIRNNNIDTRLPLVADYCGVKVNVSIQAVLDHEVKLYAPVFDTMEYRFASDIGDYVTAFDKAVSSQAMPNNAFCCNCILNFLYGELEGKRTGNMTGPITFGEVAYQLVNQTMAYLSLEAA